MTALNIILGGTAAVAITLGGARINANKNINKSLKTDNKTVYFSSSLFQNFFKKFRPIPF